jgi:hypothetical protein
VSDKNLITKSLKNSSSVRNLSHNKVVLLSLWLKLVSLRSLSCLLFWTVLPSLAVVFTFGLNDYYFLADFFTGNADTKER